MAILDRLLGVNPKQYFSFQKPEGYRDPRLMLPQGGLPPNTMAVSGPNMQQGGVLPGGGGVTVSPPEAFGPLNANEFIPKPGANNLDRVRAGKEQTDNTMLFDLIGKDSKADKYLALALGGFSMAEAAGKPGATFLSSLGAGGKAGVAGAIAARSAAQKAATAKTLAEAKLAAARAKKQGTPSTLAKEIQESTGFPIGSVGHMTAMSEAMGTRELSKLPNAMQIATLLNPGADPDTIRAEGRKIAMGSIGSRGERMATRMLEIEKAKPQTYTTDPEYIKAKGIYDASIADYRTARQTVQAAQKTAELQAKIDSPLRTQLAKRTGEIIERADSALQVMVPVAEIEETLMAGQVETGGGADFFTGLASLASTLGIDYNKAAKRMGLKASRLSDAQYMRGQSNAIVASILSGKAFGNNPSNKDLEFIVQMVQGLGVDEVANIKISEYVFNNYKRLARDGIRVMGRSENRLYGRNASQGENSETKAMKNKLAAFEKARKDRFIALDKEMREQFLPLSDAEKERILDPSSSLTVEEQILRRKARIYNELIKPKYKRMQ